MEICLYSYQGVGDGAKSLQFQEKNLRGIQIKYIEKKIIIKYWLGKGMSSSMNVHVVVPYRLLYRGTVHF
jgi:hypothetical protein